MSGSALPVVEGRKRFTLRNKRYGKPGEVIPSTFGPVRILSVVKRTPAWVRDNLWHDEGCASPADFTAVWNQIHPTAPGWEVERFLHEFEFVGNLEDAGR